MLPYILHTALLLCCFFLLYKFLLERETFFQFHRWLLLGSILLSFSLPVLEIPQTWSVWQSETSFIQIEEFFAPTGSIAQPNPASIVENEVTNSSSTSVDVITQVSTPSIWSRLSWTQLLFYIYLLGVGIFGVNLLIQLGTLLFKIIRLPSLKDDGYRIVELEQDEPPYSFWNCVFINPTKYDWDTYSQIIEHEKIHIQQGHSLDMLIAELLVVVQWFNPAAWQYRKLIENNLEFLTDSAMLRQGATPEVYQLNLLKVSVPQYPIGLAMNYNQSFLKTRINMMNVKKSSVRASWKYLLLLPILGLSIVCLNAVEVNAQEEQNTLQLETMDSLPEMENISSTEVQNEIEAKEESEFESNPKSESTTLIASTAGQDLGELSGKWYAEREGNEFCFRMEQKRDINGGHHWQFTKCFLANELTTSGGTTKLIRDAGTLDLNESLTGNEGMGRFTFTPSETFKSYLSKTYAYSSMGDNYMFHLFVANVNKDYLNFLRKQGYDNIPKSKLQELAIHGLDMPYLKTQLATLKKAGIEQPSLGKLVELRIHGVSSDYIDDMASVGLNNLSLHDLLEGRIHGVNPDYVREIRGMGYEDLRFHDYVEFRIHGVNRDVVEALSKAGFDDLSASRIKEASIHGVSADYIDEMTKIGFPNLSLKNLIDGRIHSVRTSYVQELRDMGYKDLDFQDVIEFSIHGVDTHLVASLSEVGFKNLSAERIKSASIHGVSASYIKKIRASGYNLRDIQDLIDFKIHGVTPRFIADLEKMGYHDVDAHDIKNAAVHGVRTDFIRDIRALGFNDMTLDDAIELRIHGVSANYIEKARSKGHKNLSLDEYRELKILGRVR